jgi:hypothetical protein
LLAAFGGDFDFQGNFYFSSTQPNAPNPRLSIDGIGTVGLPLSERDAKAIVSCAIQAPFGKGDQTVVDTKVRDTWEIEPAKVAFENPAWTPWLENFVFSSVWSGLGVAPSKTTPRCELYKLLLYEQGSQ